MEKDNRENSPFSKLMQVGVVVKDMDTTIDRLNTLGIGPFVFRSIPPKAKEYFRGKPLDAKFKISGAMMGDIDLELIEPVDGKSPHQEFLDAKGEGIQHLAFEVDDLDSVVEDLTQKGATVLFNSDLSVIKVAYLELDAGGLVFEFIQKK